MPISNASGEILSKSALGGGGGAIGVIGDDVIEEIEEDVDDDESLGRTKDVDA